MNYIDIIILVCVIAFVSVILYFNIRNFKNKKCECSKCPYAKKCNKQNIPDACNNKDNQKETKITNKK